VDEYAGEGCIVGLPFLNVWCQLKRRKRAQCQWPEPSIHLMI
jgi:hypothetical protein